MEFAMSAASGLRWYREFGIGFLIALAACGRRPDAQPTVRVVSREGLGKGLELRTLQVSVRDRHAVVYSVIADRDSCWAPVALSASGGAWGIRVVSDIAAAYDTTEGRAAALYALVSGDYYDAQKGPGEIEGYTPTGLLVHRGRVVAGALDSPGARPWRKAARWSAFAVDSAGGLHVDRFAVEGRLRRDSLSLAIGAWNRYDDERVMWIDSVYLATAPSGPPAAQTVAMAGGIAALGTNARTTDAVVFAGLRGNRPATAVDLQLKPFAPSEAVGGFPVLLEAGAVPDSLAARGTEAFREPNRRAAIGYSSDQRRVIVAVVDSGGLTVTETADLMKVLGASDALNLDGGPSPALVARVRGHLSDVTPNGNAPVGSAIGIVMRCRQMPIGG